MRKTTKIFFAVAVVVGFVGIAARAGDDPKVLLKMTTLAPKNSAMADVLTKVDQEIRQKSNNEVGIRVYYGGIQGDENEAVQKMRLKQLHGGMFTASGLHRIVPAIHILSIPYLYRNYDEVLLVRKAIAEEMGKQFLNQGYVVLAWGEAGFAYQFSKVPITSNEVAKKQKYWQWGDDPVGAAMYKAIGVTPVSLSIADVMTSLSTRLIDAATATPNLAVAMRWYTKFKYMSAYPNVCVQGATIVRKDEWDKISPKSQELIKSMSQKYYDKYVQLSRQDDRKAVEMLKKAGVQIVKGDGQQRKQAENISKKVRESLVGKLYSQELLDRVLSLLAEFRKKHPEGTLETAE